MTDRPLREVVAAVIKRQLQLYADMAGMDFRANDLEMASRAAIAAVIADINAFNERQYQIGLGAGIDAWASERGISK